LVSDETNGTNFFCSDIGIAVLVNNDFHKFLLNNTKYLKVTSKKIFNLTRI